MEFGAWGLRLWVEGAGLRVWDTRLEDEGLGVRGLGSRGGFRG